jgi:hypothetical protein
MDLIYIRRNYSMGGAFLIQWILIILLILILVDFNRLHRKLDKLLDIQIPFVPPSNEEIELMLERENNKSEQ